MVKNIRSNVKVAVDISPLSDGNSIRGVGYYTKNLVESLKTEIKTNPDYKNFKINLVANSKSSLQNYQVIHYPYFDPFRLTLHVNQNIPTIATVYDLIPREHKNHYPVGVRGEIKWFIQKRQLQKCNYLITSSHYSKHQISSIVGYPLDRIYVIYGAADNSYRQITNINKLKIVQRKYHLPDKFILYVGDINWNKNIPTLANACIRLKYPLVIVGSSAVKQNVENHPWNQDLLWLQAKAKVSGNYIILAGYIPDQDLSAIFNLATIYCQPSFAEGFGLPLVQAMQSGCPVVYSQSSCLNEIMDYNGLFFDPNEPSELETALKKFWLNLSLRKKYSSLGLNRAKVFSWQQSAIQTLALYQLAGLQNG